MPLCPIVPGARLPEHKVIWTKELSKWPCAHRVHCTGLKIHKYCAWHIPPSGRFVEVDIDTLELQVRISMIGASWVDSVLIGDHFPKLCTNLIAALTTLNVNE